MEADPGRFFVLSCNIASNHKRIATALEEFGRVTDAHLATSFKEGDQAAAALLYRRYAGRLRTFVRTGCSREYGRRFDADDVVQSVFQDLFARLKTPHDSPLIDRDLAGLLFVMTRNHLRRLVEHHSATKRSVRRTYSAEVEGRPIPVRDPKIGEPIGAMLFREQLEQESESDRRVIELRIEGFEIGEIALRTGRPRRTIERVLQAFRDRIADTN